MKAKAYPIEVYSVQTISDEDFRLIVGELNEVRNRIAELALLVDRVDARIKRAQKGPPDIKFKHHNTRIIRRPLNPVPDQPA